MTTFPTSKDNFTNPTKFDNLNSSSVPHADQHANTNDAIEAVEDFLLNGVVGAGALFRFKDGKLWLNDNSGGGTPWHQITLTFDSGTWNLDIDQTGQA